MSTDPSRASPEGRPYVILNAAMTLDGKIATKGRDSRISCIEDLKRVHRLRAKVDAIMVGINTVLIDDPKLTVKHARGRSPVRVVVDSRARTPPGARLLKDAQDVPTCIAVSSRAPRGRAANLRRAGAKVLTCGDGAKVDLHLLLERLKGMGIRSLLLEGGGSLNWGMLREGLVDEVIVAVAPMIVGGEGATTLVEGDGAARVEEGIKLELSKVRGYGSDLVLFYVVARK